MPGWNRNSNSLSLAQKQTLSIETKRWLDTGHFHSENTGSFMHTKPKKHPKTNLKKKTQKQKNNKTNPTQKQNTKKKEPSNIYSFF